MDNPIDSVVFRLEREIVWESWYGRIDRVRLGHEDHVSDMMVDFLAQRDLGKRLNSTDNEA